MAVEAPCPARRRSIITNRCSDLLDLSLRSALDQPDLANGETGGGEAQQDRSNRYRAGAPRARRSKETPVSTCVCRDCLADAARQSTRCRSCGSPRLLRHDELARLAIAHIDCDAFYATIEKRDDPALAAEPVIIGGGRRGVVATACYVARTFGVRSAMPMFEALRLCPHARVIRPDMDKYSRVGREVRQMMLALTPLVEPLSIDEAFLDLSGTERLHGLIPAQVLARFAADVEEKLRITVSIGLFCSSFSPRSPPTSTSRAALRFWAGARRRHSSPTSR